MTWIERAEQTEGRRAAPRTGAAVGVDSNAAWRCLRVVADPSAALRELGAAAQAHPDDPAAWYRWALALARADQRTAALHAAHHALPLTTEVPLIVGLGKLFEILEQHTEAVQTYRHAARLDPYHVDAQACLGSLLRRLGDARAATLTLRAAWARSPQSPVLALELAEALLAADQPVEALTRAERARELGAAAEALARVLARVHAALGHLQASGAALATLSALGDEEVELVVDVARRLALAGDAAGARALLEHGLGAARDTTAQRAIGSTLLDLGEIAPAVASLERTEQREPAAAPLRETVARARAATPRRSLAPPQPPRPARPRATTGGITSDLAIFALPEVLELLLQQRATGTLLLRHQDGHEGALELHGGQLAAARHPGGRRLAEALVEEGLVSRDVLLGVVPELIDLDEDATLTAAVLEQQLVDREALRALVVRQIEDALVALVSWRAGQASFRRSTTEGPPPPISLETRWALMGAVGRADDEARARRRGARGRAPTPSPSSEAAVGRAATSRTPTRGTSAPPHAPPSWPQPPVLPVPRDHSSSAGAPAPPPSDPDVF